MKKATFHPLLYLAAGLTLAAPALLASAFAQSPTTTALWHGKGELPLEDRMVADLGKLFPNSIDYVNQIFTCFCIIVGTVDNYLLRQIRGDSLDLPTKAVGASLTRAYRRDLCSSKGLAD
jgi:hypothetical protein